MFIVYFALILRIRFNWRRLPDVFLYVPEVVLVADLNVDMGVFESEQVKHEPVDRSISSLEEFDGNNHAMAGGATTPTPTDSPVPDWAVAEPQDSVCSSRSVSYPTRFVVSL